MYSKMTSGEKIKVFLYIPAVYIVIYIIAASYNYYIFLNESFMINCKILKNIISVIFYFFAIMALVCHTLVILVDPGSFNLDIVRNKLKSNEKERCRKCQDLRPIRSHHCSKCNRCFMRLDHHCPWVFNCVGIGNQKIFYLFLIYTILTTLMCFVMLIICLVAHRKELFFYTNVKLRKLDFLENSYRIFGNELKGAEHYILIIFGILLNFLTLTFVGGLFISQTTLMAHNITNIERDIYEDDETENPFYSKEKKLKWVLSLMECKQKWKIFLPIVEPNLHNGGYVFGILNDSLI